MIYASIDDRVRCILVDLVRHMVKPLADDGMRLADALILFPPYVVAFRQGHKASINESAAVTKYKKQIVIWQGKG